MQSAAALNNRAARALRKEREWKKLACLIPKASYQWSKTIFMAALF
jgi:hypothetical protein